MEAFFANLFDDIRLERSLILLLSLKDPDILKQNNFTDHDINFLKSLALENLHQQKCLKWYFA